MIKAIFFDFDGVLTLNLDGYTIVTENIQKLHPDLPLKTVAESYLKHREQLQAGEKNHYDIWDDFCQSIGKQIDVSTLAEIFSDTPMNHEMIELAQKLSNKYKVGIITNNTTERLDLLIDKHNLRGIFHPIIVSSKIGSSKKDNRIFDAAIEPMGAVAEECIFIDNQEKNLKVPIEMGFKTILFDPLLNDIVKLQNELESYGANF